MSRFFSFFLLILRIEVGISTLFPRKILLRGKQHPIPCLSTPGKTQEESHVIKKKEKNIYK